MDRATAFYKSGPRSGNTMSVSSQIRGNLKGKETIVELPVTVGAQSNQVIQRVDLSNGVRRQERVDGSDVTDLDMLGIATDCTLLRFSGG